MLLTLMLSTSICLGHAQNEALSNEEEKNYDDKAFLFKHHVWSVIVLVFYHLLCHTKYNSLLQNVATRWHCFIMTFLTRTLGVPPRECFRTQTVMTFS